MTHKEMINKYNLELVEGGLKATGKISSSAMKILKAAKPELIIILKEMEAERRAAVAKRKAEIKAEISAQKKTRRWALVNSGSYLIDCHIEYVVEMTVKEKSRYRADFAKNNLYKLAIDDQQIDLEKIKKESQRIKEIQSGRPNGYLGYGESAVWLISETEKTEILNELKEKETVAKTEKEAKQKKKTEALEIFLNQAKETGEPVVMYSYITSECMNGGHDCSFDSATVYMLPDGTQKTTYTCCH